MSRKVEVQIVGDSSSLHRALGSATTGTSKLGSAFGSVARLAGGLGAILAGAEVLKFGKESVMSAAQTQKATESIRENFGKAGKSVIEFNEHAASSFGIAIGPASQFATQIGLMTTNIGLSKKAGADMTIGLEKLAGAVGMIKGQDPAESFSKLNKALLGNTRGLKDMGIAITPVQEKLQAMKDGFIGPKGTISTLTAAQRAQVIYGLAVQKLPTLLDQAKKHSGDFANQLLILKAKLSNLSEEIGAKALPVIQNLVGDISKIAGAPNFTVGVMIAFHGIEKGAKSIAEGIQHALTGSTKTVQIKAPSGLILGSKQETSKGIIQTIAAGLAGADWSKVGHEVGVGLSKSIQISDKVATQLANSLAVALDAHSGDFAELGITTVIKMFADILDPVFWYHHWQLALSVAGIALTVASDGLGGVAEKVLPKLILKPLVALGNTIKGVMKPIVSGIIRGLEDVFPFLVRDGKGISERLLGGIRGLPGKVANVFERIGRFIGQELGNAVKVTGQEISRLAGRLVDGLDALIGRAGAAASRVVTRLVSPFQSLAGRVLGPVARAGRTIINAIGGIAGRAFSAGASVGRQIMEGIANGLSGLIGWLEGKIGSIASGLLDKAKGILHINSPSKVFADVIGKGIMEGIAVGISDHAHLPHNALAGALMPSGGGGGFGRGAGGGGGTEVIQVVIDGRVLGEVVRQRDRDYRRQNGGRQLISGN